MRHLIAAVPMLLASAGAFAQAAGTPARGLPTLSEYGLYGLVILVGAVGAFIARRKK